MEHENSMTLRARYDHTIGVMPIKKAIHLDEQDREEARQQLAQLSPRPILLTKPIIYLSISAASRN